MSAASDVYKRQGIDSNKSLPVIENTPFKSWAVNNANATDDSFLQFGNSAGIPVVLWLDSVNNAYRPQVLKTAVSLLGRCGFNVLIAKSHFCCGRPLYEYGFLDKARQQLQGILDNFHSTLPSDASVLVLEPSCLSVFKDELHRLFPDDTRATDLAVRTMTVAEYLTGQQVQPARTLPRGLMHLHCHGKTIAHAERQWMQNCFDELSEPASGCCGMAGTYGHETANKETSRNIYSMSWQPAIRSSAEGRTLTATGYSCRSQVKRFDDISLPHPAQSLLKQRR